MPKVGLEPTRYCYHRILSPTCLPISPFGHMAVLTGIEPAISCVTGRRDKPLHYRTIMVGKIRFALIQPLVLVLQTSATLYLRRFPILIFLDDRARFELATYNRVAACRVEPLRHLPIFIWCLT